MNSNETHVVFITSPLEEEHLERIRAQVGDRAEVIYDADLMPALRYQGDHKGVVGFRRTEQQEDRWRAHLARATILWDFPAGAVENGGGLSLAPHVGWVQTTSSGVGQQVYAMGLADTHLLVTTARGVHANALAEFVMLCVLAHAKDLPRLIRDQRAHRWERYCGGDVAGKTMTVVGAGQVGAQAARAARTFGLKVLAVVNRGDPARAAELGVDQVYGPGELREALAPADYVVIATPHTPQTERLIDARALANMKRGVVLINIARGVVIDEAAMIENLSSGHVAFAGLDVTTIEPLLETSPLWDMPNVLISPHSASTAPSENAKITEIFCTNLRQYLAGDRGGMINVLDKQKRY